MIVVVGLPGLDAGAVGADALTGAAARVALAVVAAGGRAELAGAVGDDGAGNELVVRLGHAGVGHAAVMRDPAGNTPLAGVDTGPLPRLDAEDVRLALSYLPDVAVIVLADPVADAVRLVVADAAAYHGAHLVVLAGPDAALDGLPDAALVLEAPEDDPDGRFAGFVARYALAAERAGPSAAALGAAARDAGWERAPAE